MAFLLNDDPGLVREAGADGVHLGREDMGVRQARALLGGEKIIGATCHASRHLAMEAGEAGADYAAFGAFFATATKRATARAGPDIVRWWSEVSRLPGVAIGGITPANARGLVRAGADFLAVSSGVWDFAGGEAAAVRAFNEIFGQEKL